ncbi:m7GpppX diphosphatase [Coccomyxa sp. Obi]|nr:m7GpppX diphosphatase [Coccomyxa sp. Obi]
MGDLTSLEGFRLTRILNSDDKTKAIDVLGRFEGKEGEAVVSLRRRAFDEGSLPSILSSDTQMTIQFQNDVYAKYTGTPAPSDSQINIDIIHPATEKHISKFTAQQYLLVKETPGTYETVTLPYIESIPSSRIQWVFNILGKKAEVERLIFEDDDLTTGFVLHPDMKWDQKHVEGLYCIAIVHRRDVRSLRDLRQEHLPLLRNMRRKGVQALVERYGIREDELRVYIHYQPSYYHLHVHFLHVSHDAGAGMAVGKAHLLNDIIDNIEIMPDYYARRTLTYVLGERDPLLQAFRKRKASDDPPDGIEVQQRCI